VRTGRKWRSELLSPVISGPVGGRLRFLAKPEVPAMLLTELGVNPASMKIWLSR